MEAGILHVEQQLTRYRTLGPLETESSRREIELPRRSSGSCATVGWTRRSRGRLIWSWCTTTGRGLDYRPARALTWGVSMIRSGESPAIVNTGARRGRVVRVLDLVPGLGLTEAASV
jgi:hypothetical protein